MDLDPPKQPAPSHQLGANLERASVAELEALLKELETERLRVQKALDQKKQSVAAADAFFKK